jgi:PAS domain S-box-containing protein
MIDESTDKLESNIAVDNLNKEFNHSVSFLEEFENSLEWLANNLRICLFKTALDGTILYVNEYAWKAFEFDSREELYSTSVLLRYNNKDDRKLFIEQISESSEINSFETELITKSGKIKNMVISAVLKDNVISGMAIDTTDDKKTKKIFENSLSILRSTLESTADGILVVDRNSKVVDYNMNFLEMWSIPPSLAESKDDEKLLNFVLDQLTYPTNFINKVKYLYSHPEEDSIDILEFKDGRIFERHSHPQRQEDKIIGRVWSFREVTEKKRAQLLQDAVYKISQSANTVQDLSHLFPEIHKTISNFINAKNFYIALYDPERNLLSFPYFVDEYDEAPEPEAPRRGLTEYVIRTGEPQLVNPEVFEKLVEKGEVKKILTDSIDWLGVPLKTTEKTIGALVVQTYTEDVRYTDNDKDFLNYVSNQVAMAIERNRAEDSLLFTQFAIDHSSEAVFWMGPDAKLVYVNEAACRKLSYKRKELLSMTVYDIDPEFPKEKWSDHWNEIKSKKALTFESIHRTKQGATFPVEISANYINFGGKEYNIAFARDITERKKAEEALVKAKDKAEEMNRLKTSFLANMSHELRTPMVGILGYTEILSKEISNPELKEMSQEIHSSANRLLETLDLILDLSKVESNNSDIRAINLNLGDITGDQIKTFEEVARKKNIYLKLAIKNENVYSLLDERIFRQIVNNLVSNAIKFTHEGGVTVEVYKTTVRGKERAFLRVKDTGIGIPQKSYHIIFEEFRQVSEGLNRGFEGSGLGLNISKRFVELMHGEISVESQVGIGSTFTVDFPQSKTDKQTVVTAKKENPLLQDERDQEYKKDLPSVLLVEDDFSNAGVIEYLVQSICNLDIVASGTEALDKTSPKQYDAILMDIDLGRGISGIETTQMIRKIKGYENLPIVAVTALAMKGQRELFLAQGCTHYIAKPFDTKFFKNLMTKILSNGQAKNNE